MQLPDPGVALERALADLVEAGQRLEAAADELEGAREGAHLALRRLGAVLVQEGVAAPHELLRWLYWEDPDLHVEVMAKAFGLQNNEVGRWGAYEREVEEQRRQAHREGRYRIRRIIQYEEVPGTWFLDDPDDPDR